MKMQRTEYENTLCRMAYEAVREAAEDGVPLNMVVKSSIRKSGLASQRGLKEVSSHNWERNAFEMVQRDLGIFLSLEKSDRAARILG